MNYSNNYQYNDPSAVGWPPLLTSEGNTAATPHIDYYITLCRWCGKQHDSLLCPHVKAIDFHPDGTVKRVEFKNGDMQYENMEDFIADLDLPEDQ